MRLVCTWIYVQRPPELEYLKQQASGIDERLKNGDEQRRVVRLVGLKRPSGVLGFLDQGAFYKIDKVLHIDGFLNEIHGTEFTDPVYFGSVGNC